MANLNTDDVVMNAIAYISPGTPANTRIGSLNNPIVVENYYKLSNGRFPAIHIEAEKQRHKIQSYNTYEGELRVLLTYYDRWDRSMQQIDDIRTSIKADLNQIMANLQHNSSLTVGSTAHAVSIYEFELSPYQGEIDERTVPGVSLIKRTLRIRVNLLPYDV